MQVENYNRLDVEMLPKEARKELLDFYEFLLNKYKKHLMKDTDKVDKEVEELSWEMGQKLYSSREELYER
ncbi:MAG: hypothetical protein D4R88_09020 [Methanosarcinales archaeon]|nr:MAG: hypothetical protein D4R88_09020 [Methanosarcinales archaeon]